MNSLSWDMRSIVNLRIDSHKLMYHPNRVTQWQRGLPIYPIYVEISPCGACNHRCTFCALDYIGYKPMMLDAELLVDRVLEMANRYVQSIMFGGEGEPLLHKQIDSINDRCSAQVDTAFTTNGVLLHRLESLEKCEWVKISVNAGTKDTYAKVHRTTLKDWDTVWNNIRKAVLRKGNCTIGVQTMLLPENAAEIPVLYQMCDDAGVDYLVVKPYSQHKMSTTHQYEGVRPIPPLIDVNKCEFIFRDETYQTTKISYDKCQATPHFWAYIMANGDVYSCSAYLMDDRFRLGNINTQTFTEIWDSVKRKENEYLVRNVLDIKECRVNCRMDKCNRYLTDLIEGVPHVNYI